MKIAIVTFELEDLTRNGGIGTAYRRLAELLVREGHSVTVLFVPFADRGDIAPPRRAAARIRALGRAGISVVMPEQMRARAGQHRHCGIIEQQLERSLVVYRALRGGGFDVVHASDNCGLVYLSLLAKKAGLDFQGCEFVIGAHGPPMWVAEANGNATSELLLSAILDRKSIELADHLVSPSRYMLEYLRKSRWRIPASAQLIPNVNRLPGAKPPNRAPSRPAAGGARTVVFFGRLEERKGVFLFAEALARLLESQPKLALRALFLGKESEFTPRARERIRERLSGVRKRVSLEFVADLPSERSLEFLARLDAPLVCMPSLIDNSPYVVLEAIESGLNFLATRPGGTAELIHPGDRRRVLCRPDAEDLRRALGERLRSEPVRARASTPALRANRRWAEFHRQLAAAKRARPPAPARRDPLVSIVVDSADRLRRALPRLSELAARGPIEICVPAGAAADRVVSAGSFGASSSETFRPRLRPFDPLRATSPYLSAAQAATGKYLIFLRDAELTRPDSFWKWVRAADRWTDGDPAAVGLWGISEERAGAGARLRIPVSDPFVLMQVGPCPGMQHALWRRKRFMRQCGAGRIDLGDHRRAAPFFFRLLFTGKKMPLFPETVLARPRRITRGALASPRLSVRPGTLMME